MWATVSFVIAARQVTPEWVQTRSLSMFYVVLQGPFVIGGNRLRRHRQRSCPCGKPCSSPPWPFFRACCSSPGSACQWWTVPHCSSSPAHHSPSVSTSVLTTVRSSSSSSTTSTAEDVDDFLSAMAELRIVRRRLGGTRWGVFQDVTAYGKFFETFLVPSWQRLLLQRAHYTKADKEVEDRAFAFHRAGMRT